MHEEDGRFAERDEADRQRDAGGETGSVVMLLMIIGGYAEVVRGVPRGKNVARHCRVLHRGRMNPTVTQ